MAASAFFTKGWGRDARDAFRAAVEAARREHGGEGYTGTIAEKRSVVVMGAAANWDEAERAARRMIEANDRRIDDRCGPAGAIQVGRGGGRGCWLLFGWASR